MHQNNSKTKYGLPDDVRFCTKCVISNQRPNSAIEYQHIKETKKDTIQFNKEGICDACQATELKKNIDWNERDRELKELCDIYRRGDGRHDCIVAGSGGKDSFYTSHNLKYKYDMHPLTITWAPHIYTDWGWKNFQSWIHSGFDNYLHTPNGKIHRLLTRIAVENIFHPFQPFIIGQKAFVPKMAILLGIPLVFYGENEAEYGNPKQDMNSPKRDWKYFTADDQSKIFLSGVSLEILKEKYKISNNDLNAYMPAHPEELDRLKIDVRYMGYYLKWHPQGAYYYAVENGGFQASPERTPGTYSKYNSIDDKIDDLHYYTTFIKFGIGRATYDAAQEIRSGDITREEAVALVKRFDGEYPTRFEDELFRYLSIPRKEFGDVADLFTNPVMNKTSFMQLADQFRSPHLWEKTADEWKLKRQVK